MLPLEGESWHFIVLRWSACSSLTVQAFFIAVPVSSDTVAMLVGGIERPAAVESSLLSISSS